jgi:antimicrobial peptide system SdpA family protein
VSATGPAHRRLGAWALLVGLMWSVPTIYAVHSALPFNPVILPGAGRVDVRLWLPQGWRFFTRDAQEPDLTALRRTATQWTPALSWPYARPTNAFGLNRTARAHGLELGLLLTQLDARAWRRCGAAPAACLDASSAGVRIRSPLSRPALCGDIGLVQQRPVPWAWTQSGRGVTMPSTVVRVWIEC